jgi:hypothetical protein
MKKLLLLTLLLGLIAVIRPANIVHARTTCPDGQMVVNRACGDGSLLSLNPGWNKIEPGGETTCAHDTPYAYWVHPGARDDLLIYLEGGGGCWSADTCRDTGAEFNGFYDSRVTASDNPALRGGVLDMDNADNPFRDYTTVYIPVCTGDTHWGDNVKTFAEDVTIHFNGFTNAQTAIQWAYDNVPEPDSAFVTGCSAGSAGSIYHVPYVIQHYPDIPVYQLGDSLSLLFEQPVDLQTDWHAYDNYPDWIPALGELTPENWTMAAHYLAVANHYPDYTFSQFNTARDEVQVFFTYPDGSGSPDDWNVLLESHLDTIHTNAPNYRSVTAGGRLHCILPRGEFYNYAIGGVRFRDWVADMSAGKPVESLHCADCERAETAAN